MSTGPTDSSPESPPTLGSALRAAREATGKSVEDVSADTRIRATLVRDLEADHFASSGGLVYARGHIKSIASSLRVDPAPLLALFDQAQDTAPDPLSDPDLPRAATSFGGSDFVASAAASLRPERRTPRWGIAVAGAAVVLGGLIAVGALNNGSPTGQTNAGSASPTTASPTPTRSTPSPQPRELTASKPPVTGAQLRLRLIGGESWVSVSNAASTVLFEGLLHAGDFKDFTDPTRLKVIVGNAQPVSLNCGGRDSGPAGGPGAVRRFECTAAGLKAL